VNERVGESMFGTKNGVLGHGEAQVPAEPSEPVTLVITSCGRSDLLARTLKSFWAFNTYPISETIIAEDSGLSLDGFRASVSDAASTLFPHGVTWLSNKRRRGQIFSIDRAYEKVSTPFIFHCEDDWEFFKSGFVEASLSILRRHPEILQVWIRAHDDTNGHPVERLSQYDFDTACVDHQSPYETYHGFSFNPGLRRLSDYKRLGTYGAHAGYRLDGGGRAEALIGRIYRDMGYRSAILADGYARHLGDNRHVEGATRRQLRKWKELVYTILGRSLQSSR
jgi:hypothetical protein